jgi:hypothetical protein
VTLSHQPARRRASAGVSIAATLGLSLFLVSTPASASPTPVCAGTTCTITFSSPSSGGQIWTVPEGVTSATFTLFGAIGSSNDDHGILGGDGAEVTGTLSVAPGDALTVDVGGSNDSSLGGVNGGGPALVSGGNPTGGGAAAATTSRSGAWHS